MSLGVVKSTESSGVVVHSLQPVANKRVTFLPRWASDTDPTDVIRRKIQKPGYHPMLVAVDPAWYVTIVVLQENFTLQSDSSKYLESLGISADLYAHGS